MVLLSGGDLCEDYVYYGYSEDDIYYGRYINNEDNEEPENDEEPELEEENISISKWEYRLMLLV
jgi:hypothetical protein